MTGEEKIIRELLGRSILGPQIRADVFKMVPRAIVCNLPLNIQAAFKAISQDVEEHGVCDSDRIIKRANGNAMALYETFAELIFPDLPEASRIEGAVLALSRCLEAMEPRTAGNLITEAIPEREPYIEKLLGPGEVLVPAGPPKIGKSWLTLMLLLSLAAGIPFLGFAVPRPRRVLLLSGEGSDRRIKARLQAAVAFFPGLEEEALDRFSLISTEGRLKFDTPAGERTFDRLGEEFDVIAADPLYRFQAHGDENSHADQRALQDVFDRTKAKGKGLILVHHTRKPGATDTGVSELRGAGLDCYADSALMLSRKREGAGNRFLLKFTLRHDEEPDDMELARKGPLFIQAEPAERIVTGADVVSVLQEAGGRVEGRQAIVEALIRLTGASDSSARRAIQEAEMKGIIWSAKRQGPGQGRVYVLKENEE